jgi:hypothetical protein
MISTMRERVSAKLGNNSDNAFRMRKLFRQPGDGGLVRPEGGRKGSGPILPCSLVLTCCIACLPTCQVHFEDFRTCCESFGMQLDDDSLLALYHVYDPQGR